MLDEIEDDDKEFFLKLEEKRHKELIQSLSNLTKVIQSDDGLQKLIKQQESVVKKIVEKINGLPTPEVTVENNYKEVVGELQNVIRSLEIMGKQLKEATNKEPPVKEWEFEIVRKSSGYIEKVKAKAK